MKKHYETPTVEKIRFNYRDQVVADSGSVSDRTVYSDTCNIQSLVVNGVDVCSSLP